MATFEDQVDEFIENCTAIDVGVRQLLQEQGVEANTPENVEIMAQINAKLSEVVDLVGALVRSAGSSCSTGPVEASAQPPHPAVHRSTDPEP